MARMNTIACQEDFGEKWRLIAAKAYYQAGVGKSLLRPDVRPAVAKA